jgi:hypothetical protein
MGLSKTQHILSAIFLAAFSISAAKSDTLNSARGSWQSASSWNESDLAVYSGTPGGTLGKPYWNNYSGDGPKGNIGWCVTGGTPACTMTGSPDSTLPYYARNNGRAVKNMYFTSSGSPLTLTVDGINTNETIADAYDVFGYYLVSRSGSPTLVPLFNTESGTSELGATAPLDLSAGTKYGFYIENVKGGGTPQESDYIFYMNSRRDSDGALGPDSLQHFAIFKDGSSYIVGDVDGVGCTNNPACVAPVDFDFNDVIVGVSPSTTSAVPDPATFGLIGTGLLLFGGLLRRKLRKPA